MCRRIYVLYAKGGTRSQSGVRSVVMIVDVLNGPNDGAVSHGREGAAALYLA